MAEQEEWDVIGYSYGEVPSSCMLHLIITPIGKPLAAGGLIAALLASTTPVTQVSTIRRLVLLAPAVDQQRRTFAAAKARPGYGDLAPFEIAYLAGLARAGQQALGRPEIAHPDRCLVVHGTRDSDAEGCHPTEITKWIQSSGIHNYLTPSVGHSMNPCETWMSTVAEFLGPSSIISIKQDHGEPAAGDRAKPFPGLRWHACNPRDEDQEEPTRQPSNHTMNILHEECDAERERLQSELARQTRRTVLPYFPENVSGLTMD